MIAYFCTYRQEWNTFNIVEMVLGGGGLTICVFLAWINVARMGQWRSLRVVSRSIDDASLAGSVSCPPPGIVVAGVVVVFVAFNILSSWSNSFITEVRAYVTMCLLVMT